MNNRDKELLGIYGCLAHLRSSSSKAVRQFKEDEDIDVGQDPYEIDANTKIAQSKAFRRLMYKTQVLTLPRNAHVRKRASHTLEVAAVSSQVASILGLNASLARAISYGHDLGHTPFGHVGEEFISKKIGAEFHHYIMSAVLAMHIERKGQGLNLTGDVLRGFIYRPKKTPFGVLFFDGMSPEAAVSKMSDAIAYICADFSDFFRIGIPIPKELQKIMSSFGNFQRERVNTLIRAFCLESAMDGKVSFSGSAEAVSFYRAKELMYKIYPLINIEKPYDLLERIYSFLERAVRIIGDVHPALVLSLMTDDDVDFLNKQSVLDITHLMMTSVWEILPTLVDREVCMTSVNLNW